MTLQNLILPYPRYMPKGGVWYTESGNVTKCENGQHLVSSRCHIIEKRSESNYRGIIYNYRVE